MTTAGCSTSWTATSTRSSSARPTITTPRPASGPCAWASTSIARSRWPTRCPRPARWPEVAAEQGVATQMGTQIHAGENYRRVVELIRHGAIGEVSRLPPLGAARAGPAAIGPPRRPPSRPTCTGTCGSARPRSGPTIRPTSRPGWHHWWDFGGGMLGDMACHYMDLPFWAMELEHPATVEVRRPPAAAPRVGPRLAARALHLRSRPGPAAGHPDLDPRPRAAGDLADHPLPAWAWGVFVGSEGQLLVSYPRHELRPERKFADYRRPDPSIPPSVGHHQEWINACRGEGRPSCHFGSSMRSPRPSCWATSPFAAAGR